MGRRISKTEFTTAVRRGNAEDQVKPRARSAHYDRASRKVVVELRKGGQFTFPARIAQGLAGASERDLTHIEISPSGDGLRWPSLNADLSLANLISGAFGNEAWMRRLARGHPKQGRTSRAPKTENR